jgi:hypothetical protein
MVWDFKSGAVNADRSVTAALGAFFDTRKG